MAKRSTSKKKLSFVDIVMNAEAEEIKKAYEARIEVDKLLSEREEAYRQIARLEEQIEEVIGEKSVFVFPPPPCPVAGLESASPRRKRKPNAGRSGGSSTSKGGDSGTAGRKTADPKDKAPTRGSASPKSDSDATDTSPDTSESTSGRDATHDASSNESR